MQTIDSLAKRLGILRQEIEYCARNAPSMVHQFKRLHKGKLREFTEASDRLKLVHEKIRTHILKPLSVAKSVHGYRKGRSNVTHARQHIGAATIIRVDIEDFFPSIELPRIHKVYGRIGASPQVATLLARLTTFRGKLPLGFSTSPALANQVVSRLTHRLEGLAKKHGFSFSSYADNFEISGSARVKSFEKLVAQIVEQEGFTVNTRKSVLLHGQVRKEITGVVVNQKSSWGRDKLRKIRAEIDRHKKKGLPADPAEKEKVLETLKGKLAYVQSINDKQALMIKEWLSPLLSQ